jgi:transposase
MAATIMSKSEIERIKASLLPEVRDTSKLERKAELKKKSEERLKHWPNTLEALRIKKESFLKDREDEEERKRQEIDREVSFKSLSRIIIIK